MSLEAQEVAVRVRLLGGTAFETEAKGVADSIKGIGTAGEEANLGQGAGLTGFLGSSGKALDTVSGKLDNFSKKALQIGRQTAVLSAGASFLIYESVKEAASYEGKMTLLRTQAHATLKMQKELEAGGKGMSKFGIDPTEYADGLYLAQSVFHNVTKDLEATRAASEGAAVGHDTHLNAMNAMVAGFKTNFKDVRSFKEEMALLDETVGAGKMHLPELTSIFHGSLMPTGASLGMSQRSLLATIASVSQTGQEPEEYATRLRTALLKVVNLKGAALGAAEKMGFSKTQMQEDLRDPSGMGMVKLLQQLKAGSKRLGPNEGPAAVAEIFGGARSAGTIFTALQQLGVNEEILRKLKGVHGSGTLDRHFAETTPTLTFQFKKLSAEAKELGLELGKAFGPPTIAVLKGFVGVLAGVTKVFTHLPKPLQEGVVGFIALTAILAPVAFLLAGLSSGLRLLLWPLKAVFTGLGFASREIGAIGLGLAEGEGGVLAMLGPGGAIAALTVGTVIAAKELHLFGENLANTNKADREAHHWSQDSRKRLIHRMEPSKAAFLLSHPWAAAHAKDSEIQLSAFNRNWTVGKLLKEARNAAEHPLAYGNSTAQGEKAALEYAKAAQHLGKIEVVIHHKTDLNGRELALELIRPLEQIQRAQHFRR